MDARELLAKNARCGDGSFWKHPECKNYKLVFTGVNRDWLEYKGQLIGRPIRLRRKANDTRKGVYRNAQPLWELVTFVDPLYTEYKTLDKATLLSRLDFDDILMWYLDDGCAAVVHDHVRLVDRYKYIICIGDFLSDLPGGAQAFLDRMSEIFPGELPGNVYKNNSKGTEHNMIWNIPVGIGRMLAHGCRRLAIPGFEDKCRIFNDQTPEVIPQGSRLLGCKAVEAGNLGAAEDDMIRTCQATGRDSSNPELS